MNAPNMPDKNLKCPIRVTVNTLVFNI